jgi:hypothetical protein
MTSNYRDKYPFSEIYLEEIAQITEQAEVLASLNTLKEFRDYADTYSLHALKDSFVHQMLYALGFQIQAESENVTLPFQMGITDNLISVCYILQLDENLDNTTMVRNWALQMPHTNLLIADDVGLGKTIITGGITRRPQHWEKDVSSTR